MSSNEIVLRAGYEINTSTVNTPVTISSNAIESVDTWYSIGMVANMAASDGRDAAIQYGQAAIGDARLSAGDRDNAEAKSMMLAGLILAPWQERQ